MYEGGTERGNPNRRHDRLRVEYSANKVCTPRSLDDTMNDLLILPFYRSRNTR